MDIGNIDNSFGCRNQSRHHVNAIRQLTNLEMPAAPSRWRALCEGQFHPIPNLETDVVLDTALDRLADDVELIRDNNEAPSKPTAEFGALFLSQDLVWPLPRT